MDGLSRGRGGRREKKKGLLKREGLKKNQREKEEKLLERKTLRRGGFRLRIFGSLKRVR